MVYCSPNEDQIQISVADHLRQRAQPGVVWWHTANQGIRIAAWAHKLHRMGMRAGVCDLLLVKDGRLYCLELKREGGRPSKQQRAFLAEMNAAGAHTCIAYGIDKALAVLTTWGLIR